MNESYAIDELRKNLKYRNRMAMPWILKIIMILSAGAIGWALRSVLVH